MEGKGNMNENRNTLMMFILILVLLLSTFLGYRFLYNAYEKNHEQESKLLFYKLHTQTSKLLNKLHYNYVQIKPLLIDKHKIVEKYLEKHEYDGNLREIYEQINSGFELNPYDVYITDKNLTITNTTFRPDKGFNLSFAKDIFEKHKRDKVIEPCSPLFEKSSQGFMSYSDSFLSKEEGKRVLQVSYRYDEAKELFKELKKSLENDTSIVELKAFIFLNSGFINDMILHNYTKYKPKLDEIEQRIEEGALLAQELGENELYIESNQREDIPYQIIYLKTKSPILENTFIIYRLTFNESYYYQKLFYLNMTLLFLLIMGLLATVVIFHLWSHEKSLKEQDRFVKSSVHEIRTPLSIIRLNHELRELDYGVDEYSIEIDGAIKMLQNSYDDMSFILMNKKINYRIKSFLLSEVVQERVEYFSSIAISNEKSIKFLNKIDKVCSVKISRMELIRLIDNNLSNAIKYSNRGTVITLQLDANRLTFHSIGEVIEDDVAIFKKYVRENHVVGGYGLGLSIVKEITKKYKIETFVESSVELGTTFTYIFKCHTNVIGKG